MRLTIGTKLITGFMTLVILMLAISVVAYFNLQRVAESADVILYDEVPVADASMEAIIAAVTSRDLMGEYLLETDINKLDAIEEEYNEVLEDFDMYINAMIYGSDSEEFKTVENGAIHEMWVKDGLEGEVVIKKGNDEVINFAKQADEFHQKFHENSLEMMKHHRNSLMEQEVELTSEEIEARGYMEELDAWAAKANAKLEETEVAAKKSMDIAMEEGDKSVEQANFLIIMISVLSIILGLLIGILISRSISKTLIKIVELAKKISENDLTVDKLKLKSKDELRMLADSFGVMTDSLNTALSQVNSSVEQVASGSNQVAQASQSLSQGATEQASSLEEITSSITEISSQAKQNAENAIQASGLSKQAMENAENGNKQMQELVTAMGDINKSADEIKRIVKVIDDIAFQTNLLALNANVEAARAGKYGKGFAVVAEEVRNLASRSGESVQETTTMVEEAINNIKSGNNLVETTSKQLEEIVESASKSADLVEEIANASKEQTQGLDQINQGLGQIDQVTQSNTANAEESASAAEELASQAQELQSIVAQFKLAKKAVMEKEIMVDGSHVSSELIRKIRDEIAKSNNQEKVSHLNKLHELNLHKSNKVKEKQQQPQISHIDHENVKDVDIKAHQPVVDPKKVIKLDDQDFGKF